MLQREVQLTGEETCENCQEQLDTDEGDTIWRESPTIILLCKHCEGTYKASLNRDVVLLDRQ